jgi:hypothetical protein
MSKAKEFYRQLPEVIQQMLIVSDGWLVGSSIDKILNDEKVTDFDIAVPYDKWELTIAAFKNYKFKLNTYGGFKFDINDISIDMWPQDIHRFLKVAKVTYMFNLNSRMLLKKDE